MLTRTLLVFPLLAAVVPEPLPGADNVPPPGFTLLFNGKDLGGWHGMGHFDPRKLEAMSDEEREAKRSRFGSKETGDTTARLIDTNSSAEASSP